MNHIQPQRLDDEAMHTFALAYVQAFRRMGAPAHLLEDSMERFAERTKVSLQFHAFPGAIFAANRVGTQMLSVSGGFPQLDRLGALEDLAEAVSTGALSPSAGLALLRSLEQKSTRFGRPMTVLGFAVASGTAVGFFGGGPTEAGVSAVIGGISGVLSVVFTGRPEVSRLVDVLAGALGAFLVHTVAQVVPLGGEIALVTGLIVLLPGFSLTVALTELSTGHLVSGTTGLAAGALVFLELGFGVALGSRFAEFLWGPVTWQVAGSLPNWWEPVALVGVSLSFGVLLQARRRHLAWVFIACATALYGAQIGGAVLGPELGGGIAAFLVTVVANAVSQRWQLPAAVIHVPGILLLVPGAVGFRSVTALLHNDALAGIESAFSMAMAAMALVGGSLLGAAVIVPTK